MHTLVGSGFSRIDEIILRNQRSKRGQVSKHTEVGIVERNINRAWVVIEIDICIIMNKSVACYGFLELVQNGGNTPLTIVEQVWDGAPDLSFFNLIN